MATIKDRIKLAQTSYQDDKNKTGEMLRLERQHKQPIQVLIAPYYNGDYRTASSLCIMLGIDKATLSRWRKRFNISAGKNTGRYVNTDMKGRH